MGFPFPRENRLTHSSEYQAVFKKGKRTHFEGFSFVIMRNSLPHSRLGLIVSKREIPKAWKRNQIKRIIRETFRGKQNLWNPIDLIVMIKRPCIKQSKKQLAESFEKAFLPLEKPHPISSLP